jgi:Calcineurin-like phosphoesterase
VRLSRDFTAWVRTANAASYKVETGGSERDPGMKIGWIAEFVNLGHTPFYHEFWFLGRGSPIAAVRTRVGCNTDCTHSSETRRAHRYFGGSAQTSPEGGELMPRKPRSVLPQPLFDEPVFSQGKPTPDPTRFKVPHPSDKTLYAKIQALLYEDVVSFPPARGAPSDLFELQTAWGPHGPEITQGIKTSGRIVFHVVGDIGASSQGLYPDEIRVSDQITEDLQTSPAQDRPSFLYLLGDLIYDFGEAQYYYDQFYEPYRNYAAPIFAIPGNHDSFIVPGTPPTSAPLDTFMRNFCSTEPVVTPEAGSLHRTAMTQPGVYFTLDAPFVRIIGLFSNSLEDPGVISSEGGVWKAVPDYQLAFLTAQLSRVKSDEFEGAVLLALHHPPFSYEPAAGTSGAGGGHGGNAPMLAQIDTICNSTGVYPHAVLSGHAHNYQRYTRSISFGGSSYQVPFIVCGDGGHGLTSLVQSHLGSPAKEPSNGSDVSYLDPNPVVDASGLVLECSDDQTYGYLRVTVDSDQFTANFYKVGVGIPPGTPADGVTVDLSLHRLVAGIGPAVQAGKSTSPPPGRRRKRSPR